MKKFFTEFKKFITRGNVLDMAVGVIVGGAFTAIVNALSNNILKPIINWILALILGKDSLSELFTFLVRTEVTNAETGEVTVDLANSIYIDWGAFINAIINFLLIALVLFSIVRFINKVKEVDLVDDRLTKEDKKLLKSKGVRITDKEAVAAYLAEKAAKAAEEKAKADAEAAEKARLEREANPTTEDLLKKILAEMQK
ncbi:MAG: large conductance mechanosensitive channel protein MscL [Clostridia bacterium]|nr:large conductance mechanosensitive channel protein MscL [Clostridia bacterium]MBQ9704119.1 large conductance mechanosensitive channel protein MscL [Clostridia bacterium]